MSLVGWWPLHGTSGDAVDLSGNGNHGTLSGGVTRGVAGRGGIQAYSFDGSDDTVTVSDNSTISGLNEITISAWVNTTDPGGDSNKLVYKNNEFNFQPNWNGTNEFRMEIHDGSWHGVSTSNALTDNTWHHVLGTYDGSGLVLYVDGSLIASTSYSSSITGSTAQLEISKNSGYWYQGEACDIRIYDRALTHQEILQLYQWGSGDYAAPPGGSDSSAVSRWTLDGGSGSTAADSWGSNDGTLNPGSSGTTSTSGMWTGNGVRSGAVVFDGTDDRITISSSSSLNPTDSLSISAWVNADSLSTSSVQRVLLKNYQYSIWNSGNSSEWKTYLYDGSSFYETNTTTLSQHTGSWLHFVLSWDGTESKLYLNGNHESTTSANMTLNTTSNNLSIGANPDGASSFPGTIDDVRIYSRALSPHEIHQLYLYGTRGHDMRQVIAEQ
ncbi:MAG: LamG domain-containing protein [Candidatus Nanohaloarchaea archaeon]